MLTVGSQDRYQWLVTNDEFDLLRVCPEIAFGKYVAITSLDSSECVPTDQETANGWQSRGGIAYSPRIKNADGHVIVFVNYCFALHAPESAGLADLFWPQLARIGPESYVADNDYLTFVSMNKALFAKVHDAVKTICTP